MDEHKLTTITSDDSDDSLQVDIESTYDKLMQFFSLKQPEASLALSGIELELAYSVVAIKLDEAKLAITNLKKVEYALRKLSLEKTKLKLGVAVTVPKIQVDTRTAEQLIADLDKAIGVQR